MMGRPKKQLPMKEVIARYEAGQTSHEIGRAVGAAAITVLRRLRDAGIETRPTGTPKGQGANRHKWLDNDRIEGMWSEGLTTKEIAARLGVGRSTVYERLYELCGGRHLELARIKDRNALIRRLYVDEELPTLAVARRVGLTQATVIHRLMRMGVERRPAGGDRPHLRVAESDSIHAVRRAVDERRLDSGPPTWPYSSRKQMDLLTILRASPAPLTVARMLFVAEELGCSWSPCYFVTYDSLRRMRSRGLVERVETESLEPPRGKRRVVWFPAAEGDVAVKSDTDAIRLREIQVLMDQQEADDHLWVKSGSTVSLDAQVTEDGATWLDMQGEWDEGIEAVENAA